VSSANGEGLVIAGANGAGKSTLALWMMHCDKSVRFVSNDRLVFRSSAVVAPTCAPIAAGAPCSSSSSPPLPSSSAASSPRALCYCWGVPKQPRINAGTALANPSLRHNILSTAEQRRFRALTEQDLWKVTTKFTAPIDKCFGPGRFVTSARVRALCILNWRPTSDSSGDLAGAGAQDRKTGEEATEGCGFAMTEVDLAQRRDLLPLVMKECKVLYKADPRDEPFARTEQDFLTALSGVRVYELTGQMDFEGATSRCLKELGR
jgi:hypothetical protein